MEIPLVDLHGTRFELPFFLVQGDEYLLAGNNIAFKCHLRDDENVIMIPEGIEGLSGKRIFMPTYLSCYHRTHLLNIPDQNKFFSSCFSSVRALHSTALPKFDPSRFKKGSIANGFRPSFTASRTTRFQT